MPPFFRVKKLLKTKSTWHLDKINFSILIIDLYFCTLLSSSKILEKLLPIIVKCYHNHLAIFEQVLSNLLDLYSFENDLTTAIRPPNDMKD